MSDIGQFIADSRGFLSGTLDRFAANKQKAQEEYSQPVRLGDYAAQQFDPLGRLSQVRTGLPGGGSWGSGAQGTIPSLDWLSQHGTPYRNPYDRPVNPLDPQGFGFFGGQAGTGGKGTAATGAGTGGGTPSTGLTPGVAKWADQTRQTFGDLLDPDIMLAIMENESGGDPNAYNAKGNARGLFQQVDLASNDPGFQFQSARALAQEKLAAIQRAYAANGLNPDPRTRALDFAAAWGGHFNYGNGRFNPNSYDPGVNQTGQQWANIFLGNYDKIKAGRQQASAPTGGGTGFSSIWGGGDGPISQKFGATDFAAANSGIYAYETQFGLSGGQHTGIDVGVKRGTRLFMPQGLSGTVIERAPGYYKDEDYGDDGSSYGRGELRIQLDNGAQLILGHNSSITVRPGQRVTAGDFLALSGSANGDHVHVEVRVPDRSTPSGWRIVNPTDWFASQGSGGSGGSGASYP